MIPKLKDIDESQAPLLDHLIELRTRLMRAFAALGVAFAVCFYFADEIFGFLVMPLTAAFPNGEAALSAYTTGAAHAIIAEERLGRIAKGFRADFLILDGDLLLASPHDLRTIRVLQTWVNGELVFDAEEHKEEAPPPVEGQ